MRITVAAPRTVPAVRGRAYFRERSYPEFQRTINGAGGQDRWLSDLGIPQ